ncbi:MAG: flagellar assembly protein FliW [Gemmatimonadota bacterium]|nr:flagellar assembly protein FliW [Gemmatimonadota bacterium]
MLVHSDLLGPISVSAGEIIIFPAGLFGFPECRSFVLVATARDGMFWLQSAEYGTLAFLVVDPFLFFADYSVDLAPIELAKLEAKDATDIAVLTIVTLPRSRDDIATANLQGPIAFNLGSRLAKQIAIPDSDFGVQCPIDLSMTATS